MLFRQFYDRGLAQASYLIGCQRTGQAIVIDPIRDIAAYVETAASEGLRITDVTETHIHADFVSGSRELAAATGATMHLSAEGGSDWQYRFAAHDGARLLRDGDSIQLGGVRLDVMHTPGHTPEHLCFVVTDTPQHAGALGIISGDFVFVGDVGRPDLLERAAGVANTMTAGAKQLFTSLTRFRALAPHLQVWPGHGAGSACGKALGAVPSSTVGYETLTNWALGHLSEAEFVAAVLDGQPEPPRYFAHMKRINREGPPVLGAQRALPSLHALDIVSLAAQHCLIDTRTASQFSAAHIPGSLCIPLGKSFSAWAGSVVPYDTPLVLIVDDATTTAAMPASVRAALHELRMIGLDGAVGWLCAADALSAWREAGRVAGQVRELTPAALGDLVAGAVAPVVVDVRGEAEWSEGHLPLAIRLPLATLADHLGDVPDGPVVLQCQSGARSMVATSVLLRSGRNDVSNLTGGYNAWVAHAPAAFVPREMTER